jgi:hypothetical protein
MMPAALDRVTRSHDPVRGVQAGLGRAGAQPGPDRRRDESRVHGVPEPGAEQELGEPLARYGVDDDTGEQE